MDDQKNPEKIMLRYNDKEIREMILHTIIEMLIERQIIAPENFEKNYKSLLSSKIDENTHKLEVIPMVRPDVKNIEDIKQLKKELYVIKFYPHKLMALGGDSRVSEFLDNFKNAYRIIVVKEIAQKIYNQLMNMPKTEVFYDYNLIINPLKHELQPIKFIPLPMYDKEKKEQFMKEYNISKSQTSKMEFNDVVARFLGLKVDQFVRIIRASEITGQAPAYRIIIKSASSGGD